VNNQVLRRRDVERKTGLSRSGIYAGIAAGWFPKPIKLGPGSVGWIEAEIESWIEERCRRR